MGADRSFECGTCGEVHAGVPMAWGPDAPAHYESIPAEERGSRCALTSAACIIDGRHFYVRGRLEIPVVDGPEPFAWIVWCSLGEENFARSRALWTTAGREVEPPYFGWLSTLLPGYPDTLNLKTLVHTRPVGLIPLVELEPTDHPLALEQRNGVTMRWVEETAERLLHAT